MTKTEFSDWKNSLSTKEVFAQLDNFREEMVGSLVSGGTLGGGVEVAEKTAKVVGCIMALDYMLKMEIEE